MTPWRAVITGLSVAIGRRDRQGGLDATNRLLKEIVESADPEAPVLERIRDGETLPGFEPSIYRQGEPIYSQGDPRALALLRYCEQALAGNKSFERLSKVLSMVRDYKNLQPNNTLVCLFIFRLVGVGPRSTLFHLGRAAGWIAHAIEQHQAGEMQHRRGRYTGPLPHFP